MGRISGSVNFGVVVTLTSLQLMLWYNQTVEELEATYLKDKHFRFVLQRFAFVELFPDVAALDHSVSDVEFVMFMTVS